MSPALRFPIPLSKYHGKQHFKFQVRVSQSGLSHTLWSRGVTFPVIATSTAEAVNLIRDEVAPKVDDPTEIECLGMKGRVTYRWLSWESLMAAKMFAARPAMEQLPLFKV